MKEFFSVLEVSKLLDLSRSSVLNYIRSGKLKAVQVGKIYIISKENFGEFLKDQKTKKKHPKQNQTTFDF
ncbi:MAG: helix-turn-helix domain-containing protein [Ignavibacteriaceae bacterium]